MLNSHCEHAHADVSESSFASIYCMRNRHVDEARRKLSAMSKSGHREYLNPCYISGLQQAFRLGNSR